MSRVALIIVFVLLLSPFLFGACGEEAGFEGQGGTFDNPIGIAVNWPYVYVTNANFDLSHGKEGKINVVDMRIALHRRDKSVVHTTDTVPYLGRLILNEDKTLAYVAERKNNSILFFDLTDPRRPEQIDLDRGEDGTQGIEVSSQPFGLSLTPDGNKLFVACMGQGNISVVDLEQQKMTKTIQLSWGVNEVRVDPQGEYAYVTNRALNSLVLLDAENGDFVTSFNPGFAASLVGYDNRGLDFTPDGRYLFVASRNPSSLFMIDTQKLPLYSDQAVIQMLPMDLGPTAVAVTPDGREVWATNFDSSNVFVFNADTGDILKVLDVGAGPYDIEIFADEDNPDHYYALTANFNANNLTLIDANAKEVIWAIP